MGRNTGHVEGELAEFAVAADLVEEECRVSYTHGEYKYDLVADTNETLLRVQVKKANRLTETPWKYRIFTDRYVAGEVDLFAGYVLEEDTVFYATFDEVGSEFRVNAKSGSEMNAHNAREAKLLDDYTFERAVSKLIVPSEREDQ